jgi:hypothetical protein
MVARRVRQPSPAAIIVTAVINLWYQCLDAFLYVRIDNDNHRVAHRASEADRTLGTCRTLTMATYTCAM